MPKGKGKVESVAEEILSKAPNGKQHVVLRNGPENPQMTPDCLYFFYLFIYWPVENISALHSSVCRESVSFYLETPDQNHKTSKIIHL